MTTPDVVVTIGPALCLSILSSCWPCLEEDIWKVTMLLVAFCLSYPIPIWALNFQLDGTWGNLLPALQSRIYQSWLIQRERERSHWPHPGSKPFSVPQPGSRDHWVKFWFLRFLHVFTGTKIPTLRESQAPAYAYQTYLHFWKGKSRVSILPERKIALSQSHKRHHNTP